MLGREAKGIGEKPYQEGFCCYIFIVDEKSSFHPVFRRMKGAGKLKESGTTPAMNGTR